MAFFNNTKIKVTTKIPIPTDPGYVRPDQPITPPTGNSEEGGIVRPVITSNSVITLYKVTDEVDKLIKTLDGGLALSGGFIEDTDVLHPVVEIESELNLTTYNYAHINTTGRYYFLRVIMLPNKRYRLIMDVDPLFSWSEGIKQCIGVIKKSEDISNSNSYLDDTDYRFENGVAMSIKKLEPSAPMFGFVDTPITILVCGGM